MEDVDKRAEALVTSARDAYDRGDIAVLQHYANKLLELAQSASDPKWLGKANHFLGTANVYQGNADIAERHYKAALKNYKLAGNDIGTIGVLIGMGAVQADIILDFTESRRLFEEALELSRKTQQDLYGAFALANLGEISRLEGDYARAIRFADQSVALFTKVDNQPFVASQKINIAHYRALRREFGKAIAALRDAYEILKKHQRFVQVANYFEIWFFVTYELNRFEDAARLLGFLEFYRGEHKIPRLPNMMPWFAPRLEGLEQRLGYDVMARLRREGELLTVAQANALTEAITER